MLIFHSSIIDDKILSKGKMYTHNTSELTRECRRKVGNRQENGENSLIDVRILVHALIWSECADWSEWVWPQTTPFTISFAALDTPQIIYRPMVGYSVNKCEEEVVVACLRRCLGIFLNGLWRTTKNIRTVGVPAEIWTEYFQCTSEVLYRVGSVMTHNTLFINYKWRCNDKVRKQL